MSDRPAAGVERRKRPFTRAAQRATALTGTVWALIAIVAIAGTWLTVGAATGFPRPWELVVTAGVPFVTLLMLVVIQHTQNHDSRAMQLKLDELIRAEEPADDGMITVEDAGVDELEHLRSKYRRQASPG